MSITSAGKYIVTSGNDQKLLVCVLCPQANSSQLWSKPAELAVNAKCASYPENGKNQPQYEEYLLSLLESMVAFRTVSEDPACSEDCRRAAKFLQNTFLHFGGLAKMVMMHLLRLITVS